MASFVAFVATLAIGLFLVSVEQSGARGAGALLAAGGTLSFAAALVLAFAPNGYFLRAASKAARPCGGAGGARAGRDARRGSG